MSTEKFSRTMEILAVGKWNGINITSDILKQFVGNFKHFKDVLKVPLKLGHNEEQPMTDGHPAIGWLEDIWLDPTGKKILAKAVDMPKIVYSAIENKMYRTVSIEGALDVEHKGKNYGAVLTGLALLGADLPAVNTLTDLQAYMSTNFKFSSELKFKNRFVTFRSSKKMNEEELKLELAKMQTKIATMEASSITFKAEQESKVKALEAERDELLKKESELKFSNDKNALLADMENLVKGKIITPAMRDQFISQVKDTATLTGVKMSVDVLKAGLPNKGLPMDESAQGKGEVDKELEGKRPDEVIHLKAVKLSRDNKISYGSAVEIVLSEDKKLAEEYKTQFDKIA